ncbi:MAG: retron St85 family RNA-directed DNA polymerase [Methylophilaceae bacterium]|nr:retron St85 family RNA-directed DNA polymerase [Methylophilaceae bacterium]
MMNDQELIKQMSIDTGLLPEHLRLIIKTAPLRYKVFTIPKKNGKTREIAQPAREVKLIQRWLIQKLTPLLPVHKVTTAYKAHSSIKKNAQPHAENNFLLKIDFKDFFPSIEIKDIIQHLTIHCGDDYDDLAIRLIARCLCWAPNRKPPLRLCIGAPSSPLMSNSILHDFDSILFDLTDKKGITYTRYADDISISSSKRGELDEMLAFIKSAILKINYPTIKINPKKTVFASRKGRRFVTGIVLTSEKKLSVGRERKKLIRSMYHHFRCNKLDDKQQAHLKGLLSFVESIEPGFTERLRSSYESKGVTN